MTPSIAKHGQQDQSPIGVLSNSGVLRAMLQSALLRNPRILLRRVVHRGVVSPLAALPLPTSMLAAIPALDFIVLLISPSVTPERNMAGHAENRAEWF